MPSVLKVNEIQSDTSLPLVFNVGNAERGRINTSGLFLVGTTTAPSSTDVKVFVNSSGGGFAGFAANGTPGGAIGCPTTSTLSLYTAAGTLGAETYTERARFNSTGAFVFAGGTTTADGIGITFPATQSASTNANTLDDYEEGTWTPTLDRHLSSPTISYAFREGKYTKIGRLVVAHMTAQISSISAAGSGINRVTGLPFAADTSGAQYGLNAIVHYNTVFTTVARTGMAYLTGVTFSNALTTNTSEIAENYLAGYLSFTFIYTV